ncbi:MAG: dihydrodipicolinate synthase family protein [Candidatus Nanohaloarchaea archaeon]
MSDEWAPEGVYVDLATPIKDEEELSPPINFEALTRHLNYLEDTGVKGVVTPSYTGVGSTLGELSDPSSEHIEIVKHVANNTDLEVIAADRGFREGGSEYVKEVGSKLEKDDIEAHLVTNTFVLTPSQPFHSSTAFKRLEWHQVQDKITSYYEEIAEHLEKPIIASNTPHRGNPEITNETSLLLAENENIVGIRETTRNHEKLEKLADQLEERVVEFNLGSGMDRYDNVVYSIGGTFTINSTANIYPEKVVELWEKGYVEKDHEAASQILQDLAPLYEALTLNEESERGSFEGVHPIHVNYALELMGFDYGVPRAPLNRKPLEGYNQVFNEEFSQQSEIEDVLNDFNLLNN